MQPVRCLVMVLACATIAAAQKNEPLRTIGIVELPSLFTDVSLPDGRLGRRDGGGRLVLRARPAANGRIVATISSLEALEVEEFDYEEQGALVYARERDGSLLKTRDGIARSRGVG